MIVKTDPYKDIENNCNFIVIGLMTIKFTLFLTIPEINFENGFYFKKKTFEIILNLKFNLIYTLNILNGFF